MTTIFNKNWAKIFKELKLYEHSVYLIKVKTTKNNVKHKSYLFTGFNSGSYTYIWMNSYDYPININDIYSIKIIKLLHKEK